MMIVVCCSDIMSGECIPLIIPCYVADLVELFAIELSRSLAG
jgi:hypothetical protein